MVSKRTISAVVLFGALAASPAFADDRDRHPRRSDEDRRGGRQGDQRDRNDGARAVPRSYDVQRNDQARRQYDARQYDSRQYDARRYDGRRYDGRQYDSRQYDSRQYDTRRYDGRAYDSRAYSGRYYDNGRRAYVRPYYSDRYRYGYGSRFIRPRIVTVVPYRPYVYRPSFGIGIYYGAGGSYPYGYTPRGYYDPIPGRLYGGVRITNAPRDAQVFVDGYYVGIVDDFDGVFQHVNLEAGEHHIEVQEQGYDPIAFDVVVQPGQTITYRADLY